MGEQQYLANISDLYYKEITTMMLETENRHVQRRHEQNRHVQDLERVNEYKNYELL